MQRYRSDRDELRKAVIIKGGVAPAGGFGMKATGKKEEGRLHPVL